MAQETRWVNTISYTNRLDEIYAADLIGVETSWNGQPIIGLRSRS